MDICKHRWEPREQSSAAPGTRHPATLLITLRPVSFPFCFDPLSPPPHPPDYFAGNSRHDNISPEKFQYVISNCAVLNVTTRPSSWFPSNKKSCVTASNVQPEFSLPRPINVLALSPVVQGGSKQDTRVLCAVSPRSLAPPPAVGCHGCCGGQAIYRAVFHTRTVPTRSNMFFLPVFPELGNEVERLDQIWQACGTW